MVLPLEAGIGQTPQSLARAASDLIRSGLSPMRISISAAVIVEIPWELIKLGAFSLTIRSSSCPWAWISSCKFSHLRAIARMAALAEAVVVVTFPGLSAAM